MFKWVMVIGGTEVPCEMKRVDNEHVLLLVEIPLDLRGKDANVEFYATCTTPGLDAVKFQMGIRKDLGIWDVGKKYVEVLKIPELFSKIS